MDSTGSRPRGGGIAACCIGTGLGLLSFALLLHPMSPEHFFALLITDPFETVRHEYGRAMGILFWISAALTAGGLGGCLHAALRARLADRKTRCTAASASPG